MTSTNHPESMHAIDAEETLLTSEEAQIFSSLVKTLQLDEQEAHRILGVSLNDVSQWANGSGTISASTRSRINEIQSTIEVVSLTTFPENIPSLLRSPMEMLENKTPLDLIVEGSASRFRNLVTNMQHGVYL